MANISTITENSIEPLKVQVEKPARSAPSSDSKIQPRENTETVTSKGDKEIKEEAFSIESSVKSPSYEETFAVAEKLQARIDEIASEAHTVSIRTDESTKQYVIEIQDPEGKTLKQFPSEKVLNLHQKLDDLSGMVIDEMI